MEITLDRPGDNKTHLTADLRCKQTTLSLQREHFTAKIFWMPDGSPLRGRLPIVENLLAIILISITVRTEEFANLFVTWKLSRTLDKRENQSLDDLLEYKDKNLGRLNEVPRINILDGFAEINVIWT